MNERGLASWYGKRFHGLPTSSGEIYDMYGMTAAHKTMPIPSYARVRNPRNGREIVVRINDRGPFVSNRSIDLSYTAALKLGVLAGVSEVEIERITGADIRTGVAFRRQADGAPTAVAAVSPGAAGGDIGSLAPAVAAPTTRVEPPPLPAPTAVIQTTATPAQNAPAFTPNNPAPAEPATASTLSAVTLSSGTPTILEPRPNAPVAASGPLAPAPPELPADAKSAPGFWVQLGAYRRREGAIDLQRQLSDEQPWLAPLLAVFTDQGLNRLQAGPYRSRADAKEVAERLRLRMRLAATVVEKH